MSAEPSPGQLGLLLAALDRSAREIDQVFADFGDRLGHSLTVHEGLGESLSAVAAELAGSAMDTTRAALQAVAGALRSFDRLLPGEAAGLDGMARRSDAVAGCLDQMDQQIRFLTAVARSAQIEASRMSARHDGLHFFDGIAAPISQARRTITQCLRDHDRLHGLIDAAARSQHSFTATHGSLLAPLAATIEGMIGQIEERQRRSVELAAQAVRQSQRITLAAGGAIFSLQCGDSCRQRMEHALAMLRLAGRLAEGPCDSVAGLDPEEYVALRLVLQRLAAAQFDATAAALLQGIGEIDVALRQLAVDMAASTAIGGASFSKGGLNSASFLTMLEHELARASDLVGKSDTARQQFDRLGDSLIAFTAECRTSARSLARTVSDITLTSMNASLYASRLGRDGLCLVAIAREMKAAADRISADAGRLPGMLDLIQASAVQSRGADTGDAEGLASLHGILRQSVAWMRAGGDRLQTAVQGLMQDDTGFADAIEAARSRHAAARAATGAIAAAARQLLEGVVSQPGMPDPSVTAGVRDVLNRIVWPTYTMAAERQIHQHVLGGDSPVLQPADALAEMDAFLL